MFEEHRTEIWICPKCGEVDKIRVEENTKRRFERNSFKVFEYSGGIHTEMKVFCYGYGSECYRR